ncbi:radical SAM protein, partial [Clavibacter lycopersici]
GDGPRPRWSQEGADSRATTARGRGSWTQTPAPGPLVAAALPAATSTQATLF